MTKSVIYENYRIEHSKYHVSVYYGSDCLAIFSNNQTRFLTPTRGSVNYPPAILIHDQDLSYWDFFVIECQRRFSLKIPNEIKIEIY